MHIEAMIEMKDKGLSYKEIAEQIGSTVSKVRYRILKFKKQRLPADYNYDFDLQQNDNISRIFLLVKDSHTLYAYWEMSNQKKRMIENLFNCSWNELPKFIRVYDITFKQFDGNNSNRDWLIPVNEEANNWFISGINERCNYCVDYGTTTIRGTFFSFLRSNAVRVGPYDLTTGKIEEDTNETRRITWRWEPSFNGYSISENITKTE